MTRRSPRAGFTVIEASISIAILGVLMLVYLSTVDRSYDSQEQAEAYFRLRARAMHAMSMMREDLSRAGYTEQGGIQYPSLYQADEVVGDDFVVFDHAISHALYDEAENGIPNTDVVFVLPQDADGDGWPDVTAAGTPDWGASEIAFLLVPDQFGTNTLRRVTADGAIETIARSVSWVDFDSPTTSAFEVPLGCLRVRLALVEMEGSQVLETYEHVMTVRLRNGGLL